MCTGPMVCHGDKFAKLNEVYSPEHEQGQKVTDCSPATFYVTRDGKYAIDADFIDDPENIDLDALPKIKIGATTDAISINSEEKRRKVSEANGDLSALSRFYVTEDGRYLIDADLVPIDSIENVDIEAIEKIALKA